MRISHAKAHGFLRGELVVEPDLPFELAQGLFASARSYPVVIRYSHSPGELIDDRKVSAPRGLAMKVFGVEGEKLAGHDAPTQDFVLNTGKIFLAHNAKDFLAAFTPNATIAPALSDTTKGVISDLARAGNAVAHLFGGDIVKLDFFGHPKLHPLGESYFSQVPLRYGDFVCKLGVVPASKEVQALFDQKLDLKDENAYRSAYVEFFRTHAVELAVVVQLMTDRDTMPIEDGMATWSEDQSPYRKVARIVLPAQNAFDDGFQDRVDRDFSFSPAHSLAAHRPLGSIMRARLAVYPEIARRRREENGRKIVEPLSPEGA